MTRRRPPSDAELALGAALNGLTAARTYLTQAIEDQARGDIATLPGRFGEPHAADVLLVIETSIRLASPVRSEMRRARGIP